MLRIALVQQCCEKAAFEDNLDALCGYLDEAAARRVDIAAFPEMTLTGYADPTRYPQAILRLDGPEMGLFLRRTAAFPGTLLAGLIEENPGGKPWITQVVARQGKLAGVYRKLTIEDEEAGWFAPGADLPGFRHDGRVFSGGICADTHNPRVFAAGTRQGARIIFELAAPGLYGEQAARNWQSGYAWWEGECQKYLSAYARRHGCWIATATQAGRTVNEDFPGGGYLFNPQGQRLFATRDWSPGAAYLEIDPDGDAVREI